jgi:hypothetical protein
VRTQERHDDCCANIHRVSESPSLEGLQPAHPRPVRSSGQDAEIRQLGFDEVSFERLSLGIVAIHIARKPSHGDQGVLPLGPNWPNSPSIANGEQWTIGVK